MAPPPLHRPGQTVARLHRLADQLAPTTSSSLAREFLAATRSLPWIQPRWLFQDPSTKEIFNDATRRALSPDRVPTLLRREFNEHEYYEGRYAHTIAFVTLIDALTEFGVESLRNLQILEIGFGSILSLRLLASLGANVTGVERDTLPLALYANDAGPVRVKDRQGNIRILAAPPVIPTPTHAAFNLIVSRNTLKNGYVHPAAEYAHEPNTRLGQTDEEFLAAGRAALAPHGLFVISNWYEPNDTGPGRDARSPFSREQFRAAGFEVLAHDRPDDARASAVYSVVHGNSGTPSRAFLTVARAI